jgi:LuxR family maltose regulon positive regulatory protein
VLAALRTVAPGLGAGVDDALLSAAGDLTELALARLRASAELLEVRIEDLRLSTEEATALLNGSLRLGLTQEQVRILRERTEGWAAGLQLVGLSLRGRENREGYIASFAGDDRQIVDYLMAEVLDRQTLGVREFLLRTSIAARLTGSLCDALLDRTDSARRLVELERANLFLISLDERRQWYRYHHLFGDLLLHELSLAMPDEVVPLHRRAYEWHLREGLVAEAITHAIAAGDHSQAA